MTDRDVPKLQLLTITSLKLLTDRRIKVRKIAQTMSRSKERVCHILNQDLDTRKLSAHWVSCLLSLDKKPVRMNIWNTLLAQFRHNKSEFSRQLLTLDETWKYQYTHETKKQLKHRTVTRLLKKLNLFFRLEKWYRLSVWDSYGVILIDYLQTGKTLQGHTTLLLN